MNFFFFEFKFRLRGKATSAMRPCILPQERRIYSCDACGQHYSQLSLHFRDHPACRLQILGSDDEDSEDDAESAPKPPSSLAAQAADGCRLDLVSNDLSDFRYVQGLDGPAITCVQHAGRGWVDLHTRAAMPKLNKLLRDGVSRQDVLKALEFDPFAGLDTPAKEAAYMREHLPCLEPRVVTLGEDMHIASFDFGDLITRKLQNDEVYRKACIKKSDEWKRGEHWQQAHTHTPLPSPFHSQ